MRLDWENTDAAVGIRAVDDSRGGEVVDCVWADDETGEYECLSLRNGLPYVNDSGEVATEVRKGQIRFIFPDANPD